MQDVYMKSGDAFKEVMNNAKGIGDRFRNAKEMLGVAKFNLQQANNKLFVAQARK